MRCRRAFVIAATIAGLAGVAAPAQAGTPLPAGPGAAASTAAGPGAVLGTAVRHA